MRLGVPILKHFRVCIQASEYKEAWSYETHGKPIAMSKIVILYVLSKLTKQSDKICQKTMEHALWKLAFKTGNLV